MAVRPLSSVKKDTFRRRSRTFMKKAHELGASCGAKVYVVVNFNGQFHVYNSTEASPWWPPSQRQIVSAADLESRCQR